MTVNSICNAESSFLDFRSIRSTGIRDAFAATEFGNRRHRAKPWGDAGGCRDCPHRGERRGFCWMYNVNIIGISDR